MIPLISGIIAFFLVIALLTDAFSRTLKEYHIHHGSFLDYFICFLSWFFFTCGVWKFIELIILGSQIIWWLFNGSYN